MVDPSRHEARAAGRLLEIGATEFKLLRFFVAHPERVFSRAQLLDQVWGDHTFIEERTVDVHILRLRKALAASQTEDLVQTVRGAGIPAGARLGDPGPVPVHRLTLMPLQRAGTQPRCVSYSEFRGHDQQQPITGGR